MDQRKWGFEFDFEVTIGSPDVNIQNRVTNIKGSQGGNCVSPFGTVCMFDKSHLMCNFKSKVSRDFFKNKNECRLTYTFYSTMSSHDFLLKNQYFEKSKYNLDL